MTGPLAKLTHVRGPLADSYGTAVALVVFALVRWENGEQPAWESPPLAARIRHLRLPVRPTLHGAHPDES